MSNEHMHANYANVSYETETHIIANILNIIICINKLQLKCNHNSINI